MKEKLLSRIEILSDGCWQWLGAKNEKGYAKFMFDRKCYRAHRLFYKIYKGDIPEGLEIDHKCRNRSCCNPDHLEAVTHKENLSRAVWLTKRGQNLIDANLAKTHCPKGHPYSGDNLVLRKKAKTIHRECRACNRVNNKIASQKFRLMKQIDNQRWEILQGGAW